MSAALDNVRKVGAVMGAIDVLRDMKLSDDSILEEIMKRFELTKEEAEKYMLLETA